VTGSHKLNSWDPPPTHTHTPVLPLRTHCHWVLGAQSLCTQQVDSW